MSGLSFKPFANLTMTPAGLAITSIPDFITRGAWLIVTNQDIRSTADDSKHFAEGHRKPGDPRRVILLERPSDLPRLIKVRSRSSSDASQTYGYPHPPHDHLADFQMCCCTFDPSRPRCHVSKGRFTIESSLCTASNFCCAEPKESTLWKFL